LHSTFKFEWHLFCFKTSQQSYVLFNFIIQNKTLIRILLIESVIGQGRNHADLHVCTLINLPWCVQGQVVSCVWRLAVSPSRLRCEPSVSAVSPSPYWKSNRQLWIKGDRLLEMKSDKNAKNYKGKRYGFIHCSL